MKKEIFAVCDLEPEYVRNFLDHISRKRGLPFELQAFTSAETLIEYGRKQRIAVLLISPAAMRQEIREMSIEQVFLLSSEEGDGVQTEYPCIYKYQSSAQVLREVMSLYGAQSERDVQGDIHRRGCRFLGICSPIGRCGKTSFAIALAQILCEKYSVLYLNLEEYCSLDFLTEPEGDGNLGDLLYLLGQDSRNLPVRLKGMIHSIYGMDYIPPVNNPGDLREAGRQTWCRLLELLECHTPYDAVILDIGREFDGLFSVLERCSRIYVPIRTDPASRKKLRRFRELLETRGDQGLMKKITRVALPVADGQDDITEISDLKAYVRGPVGAYVRAVLRHERAREKEGAALRG